MRNPLGKTQMSVRTVERLITRYFRVLVDGAQRAAQPVTRESWWPEFGAFIEALEARLRSEGAG